MASVMVNSGGLQAFVDGRLDGLGTGIGAISSSTFSAWPIPSISNLMVRSTGSRAAPAELLSATGQVVLRQTLVPGINTLDLSALDAGIYVLRISSGEAVRVVKE